MRSKLLTRLAIVIFGVALEGFSCQSYGGNSGSVSGSNHYSQYPAYSTLTDHTSYKTNSFSPSSNGGVDLTSVGDGSASQISSKDFDSTNNVQVALGDQSNPKDDPRSNPVGASSGYNIPSGQQQSYYYEVYPQQPQAAASQQVQQRCYYTETGMKCRRRNSEDGQSFGNGYHRQDQDGSDDEDGVDGAGIGGLAGLVGLLGLKGLKALKFSSFPFQLLQALPLLPLLIPLIPIIALIALAPFLLLLLIPIPVIVAPPVARSGTARADNLSPVIMQLNITSMAKLTSEVLQSDQCIERISCEIGQMSRRFTRSNILERFVTSLPMSNRFSKRIYNGLMKDSKSGSPSKESGESSQNDVSGDCSAFVCKPRTLIGKHISSRKL